jgi:hypothetical protein
MSLLAFDPVRLDALRIALGVALDDLRRLRGDDGDTADAMLAVRSIRRALGDVWLPRVSDVLNSKAMTSSINTKIDDRDTRNTIHPASGSGPVWAITRDPQASSGAASAPQHATMFGPYLPGSRSFGEVLAAIQSGELVPMKAPLDANGRAGAHYTSIAIAPGLQQEVGHADLTSSILKFADFMSDGLPVGWRENDELKIIYVTDARVVSSVHVLTAYDRDSGPETLIDRTTEANVSGFLVLKQESSTAEVSVSIGPGIQDPTQSFAVISESSFAYSGVFYPDNPPSFEPISKEPRFVNPPVWTFTKSASPMVDGWGTWGI